MLKVGQIIIHARTGGLDTITGVVPEQFLNSDTKENEPGYELQHHSLAPERMLIEVPDNPPDIVPGDRVFLKKSGRYATVIGKSEMMFDVDGELKAHDAWKVIMDPDFQSAQKHLTGVTGNVLPKGVIILPVGMGRPTGVLWPNMKRDLFSS